MEWNYLDNNATTQPAKEVVVAVREMLKHDWGNPSSIHRFGQTARQRVDLARSSIGELINSRDRELIFTSGGTESNNLALYGVLDGCLPKDETSDSQRRILVTTKTEHVAIRQPAEHLERRGGEVVYLPVDRLGRVSVDDLKSTINEHACERCLMLVSILWANNETGVIQPIKELAEICRSYRGNNKLKIVFHTDATQAVGKIPVDVNRVPVDLLTLSAHKFHGPKGIGALYVRPEIRLTAQIRGGFQEREQRGGTENAPGIIGMGVAAELARSFLSDQEKIDHLTDLRNRFEQTILHELRGTVVNPVSSTLSSNSPSLRLWNTTNLGFPHLESEAILIGLSERGLCVSAGAACSSGSLEPSPVLTAMGIPESIAHGSVRFSLSRFTTDHQIDDAITTVVTVVKKLAKTLPLPA